jgi:hypothetical protein
MVRTYSEIKLITGCGLGGYLDHPVKKNDDMPLVTVEKLTFNALFSDFLLPSINYLFNCTFNINQYRITDQTFNILNLAIAYHLPFHLLISLIKTISFEKFDDIVRPITAA